MKKTTRACEVPLAGGGRVAAEITNRVVCSENIYCKPETPG